MLSSDQIACDPVMESGLFTMGALWQQFGVRVDRLSHINVRSQTSKKNERLQTAVHRFVIIFHHSGRSNAFMLINVAKLYRIVGDVGHDFEDKLKQSINIALGEGKVVAVFWIIEPAGKCKVTGLVH